MHLSSQYACETQSSYYLHSAGILQFCKTESWTTEGESRQAGLLQTWQQEVPPGAQLPREPWLAPALASSGHLLLPHGTKHRALWCTVSRVTGQPCQGVVCPSSVVYWWRGYFKKKGMNGESSDRFHGFAPLLQWSSRNDVDVPTWQLLGSLFLVVGAKPFLRGLERNKTNSPCEQ